MKLRFDGRWPVIIGSFIIIAFALVAIGRQIYIGLSQHDGMAYIGAIVRVLISIPELMSLSVVIFLTHEHPIWAGFFEVLIGCQLFFILSSDGGITSIYGGSYLFAGYLLIGIGGILTLFRVGLRNRE